MRRYFRGTRWVLILVAIGGCQRTVTLPPAAPPPARAMTSEDLPATSRIELAIGDLSEIQSDDKVEVVLSGLVINRGTRPTTSVKIHVEALNQAGLTVRDAFVTPSSERIPPGGGSARFNVVFPNDPAVVDYHIEAIGYALGAP